MTKPKQALRITKTPRSGPRTLCIDIGGTGLKALILDAAGAPLTERARVKTPRPAQPLAVMDALEELVTPLGRFDRISVGFPGVVEEGVVRTAPNLHPKWNGLPFAKQLTERLGKPARVLNDAGLQGAGVVEGKGVELLLTLGTGMGCALFVDGRYVPNLELAHHPFRRGKTYEEYVGLDALKKKGAATWNHHVKRVVEQVLPVFNPRRLYLGGGNATRLTLELPKSVKVVSNLAGLLGGIVLWRDA